MTCHYCGDDSLWVCRSCHDEPSEALRAAVERAQGAEADEEKAKGDADRLRRAIGQALGRTPAEVAALTDAELADRVEALGKDRDRLRGELTNAHDAVDEVRAERDAVARERDAAVSALADKYLPAPKAGAGPDELRERLKGVEARVAALEASPGRARSRDPKPSKAQGGEPDADPARELRRIAWMVRHATASPNVCRALEGTVVDALEALAERLGDVAAHVRREAAAEVDDIADQVTRFDPETRERLDALAKQLRGEGPAAPTEAADGQ